ncbi:MAG: MFS transporter [Pedosphaera sp.]|nr:MFS transporter [Pedosphaera sp.]
MDKNANWESKEAAPPLAAWKWWVVFLMLLATVVNYIDRQALGSMASFIKADFKLNEEGYGTLEAWFGYSYAISVLFAGFASDRWNLRWLYPAALLVWSIAGFATGFVETLLQLQICRAVLGAGEAFNWPVAIGVIRRIIPRESQGFANGVFNSGMTVGAILTPMLVMGLVGPQGEGWRKLFLIAGAVGSIWILLWLAGTRGERAIEIARKPEHVERDLPPVAFRSLFTLRTFWITVVVGITINMSWHFFRVWLPRHLVVDLKFNDHQLQYLLIGFYLAADVGSILLGLISRRLVTPNRSVAQSRRIVGFLSAGLCLPAVLVLFVPLPALLIPCYCMAGAGIMGGFILFYVFAQDVAPGHTSKCVGMIGAAAWLINSRLHPMVGHFADTHAPSVGKFAPMIVVAAMLPLLAALAAGAWPEKSKAHLT